MLSLRVRLTSTISSMKYHPNARTGTKNCNARRRLYRDIVFVCWPGARCAVEGASVFVARRDRVAAAAAAAACNCGDECAVLWNQFLLSPSLSFFAWLSRRCATSCRKSFRSESRQRPCFIRGSQRSRRFGAKCVFSDQNATTPSQAPSIDHSGSRVTLSLLQIRVHFCYL